MELSAPLANGFIIVNKFGATPIIGTLVGVVRTIVMISACIAFFILSRIASPWESRTHLRQLSFAAKQLGLGVAEIIPLFGSLVHFILHYQFKYSLDSNRALSLRCIYNYEHF